MSFLTRIIPKSGIKVAYIDNDGKKIGGITVDQANQVAQKYPGKIFYFQNGDGLEEELNISQVNQLLPTDLLPETPECSTQPQVCGPPLVRFFGGGGTGIIANTIISPISSSVIGFDIIDPGFGFLNAPSAEIIDPCGKGSGSKLRVNMTQDSTTNRNNLRLTSQKFIREEVNTDDTSGGEIGPDQTAGVGGFDNLNAIGIGVSSGVLNSDIGGILGTLGGLLSGGGLGGLSGSCQAPKNLLESSLLQKLDRNKKVKNITIISPGDGYLNSPDGSLGGNERVWKEPDEGFVRTKCGGYFVVQPYRPVEVEKGDVYFPPDAPPTEIQEDQVITLPLVPVIPPNPESLGTIYPVVLFIEEIVVLDPGFGYRPGDQLIITPDNGSTAELVINEEGGIESVVVTNPGIGFLDLPSLSTNSSTGFNAIFSPILKPIRIDVTKPIDEQIKTFLEEQINPSLGDQIEKSLGDLKIPDSLELISVVDCVGRVF